MKTFKQYLLEKISKTELDNVEKFADKLFKKLNIDIEFTKHFFDRLNDPQNGKAISSAELIGLFKKTFRKHGKTIAAMGKNAEAILNDIGTDLNIPFVLKFDNTNNEIDFISKTIMRKKDFKSPDKKLKV